MTGRVPATAVRLLVLTVGLAGCVLTVFALALGLSNVAGVRPGALTWLVATAVVALIVPCARTGLDRIGDRLAFGPGGDPYAVMAGFVRHIADALAIDDVLPHLARTATNAVHSPRGEVRLWLADGSEWRQTWPPEGRRADEQVSIPLRHDGSPVGQLGVEAPDENLSPADREVLERLAGPAGLALANVRLTYELRHRLEQEMELAEALRLSRQRLLDAASAQRRRFAAAVDLQVQRPLAAAARALTEMLAGTSGGLGTGRSNASAVAGAGGLSAARAATQEALDALRDLAAGVFPMALLERGLAAALDLHLQRGWSRATLDVGGIAAQRFPSAVEAVAYYCAVALVDDLVDHDPVRLTVAADEATLQVRVQAPVAPSASTAQLVRDRAEAYAGRVQERQAANGAVTFTVILRRADEPTDRSQDAAPATGMVEGPR